MNAPEKTRSTTASRVDLDASVDALISTWLDRLEEDGVDPLAEARRLVDEAPAALRPRLQTQLGELMQMAQTTVQSARLHEGGSLGPYRLVRLLGSGATGSVWEAEDGSGARWALKILHPVFRAADEGVTRLRNELEQRRDVDLAHLVPAHELLDLEGVLAVRCELVGTGRTLAHQVQAARDGDARHDPRKVLVAILPALRALAGLHEREIIHGDVKPGNLVLDGAGLCHLSDLGLAQPFHEASRRLHGHALGTPAYLAPELQSDGGAASGPSAASDVWAAGVLLQEAMTLHRPFDSPSLEGLGTAGRALAPRGLRLPRPEATRRFERDLRSIVARCLQRDQAKRYPNAGELVSDLERLARGRPVVGAPHGALLRMAFERQRSAVLAVGAALVVGLGGSILAQHYKGLGQRLASEKQGTERANALLDRALAALRSDAISREAEVQRLLDEMGTLVPADAPGDPLVRASILAQFTFLVSQAPLPNRESLPAIERLCQGALDLLPSDHAGARADVWIQRALLAARSWRFDLASESWSHACRELERALEGQPDVNRQGFEVVRLAWSRSQLAVARAELGAVYAAAHGQRTVGQLQAELEAAIQFARDAGDEAWALRCELGANQLAWHAGDATPLLAWRAEAVLEDLQAHLGRLHPWTLDAHYNAAFATYRAPESEGWDSFDELASAPGIPEGRPRTREEFAARALQLFTELEDLASLALGPRHLLTALAALGRAQQVMLTGEPARAVPQYERALATLDRVMQPGSEKLRRVSTGYGICLWRAGRLEEALSVLEEQVRLCETHIETGGANWTTLIARRAVTGVLRELGRREDEAAVFAEQWDAARPRLDELALPLLKDVRWAAETQRHLIPDPAGVEAVRARYEEMVTVLEDTALGEDPDHVEAILETRFAVLRMEAIERRDAPALAKLVEAEQERAASRPRMLLAVVIESLMGRGSIAGALGDVPSAERALAEARALGEDVNPQVLFDLECSCALAALNSGNPGPARDLLRRCEELEETPEARRWIKGQARRLERALKD